MGYLGAGFAIGAATAVSQKLSAKGLEEDERFAFIQDAISKGKGEFETEKGAYKLTNDQLYADTRDWVLASGMVDSVEALTTEQKDLLYSMGVTEVYTGDVDKDNNRITNTALYATKGAREKVIKGLVSIGLAKLAVADRAKNFDMASIDHRHAVLGDILGGKGRFKSQFFRDKVDGKTASGDIINKTQEYPGWDVQKQKFVEPIAEPQSLAKRIRNFFSAADDTELIKRYAKQNDMSIEAATRFFRAGQTDDLDAFGMATLEERLGAQFGDLPDITLENLATLIPTDLRDDLKKAESYILTTDPKTLIDASYIDSTIENVLPTNLEASWDNIKHLFKDKEGNLITDETLQDLYSYFAPAGTGIKSKTSGGYIGNLLPEFNEETDTHGKNDLSNLTNYHKDMAVIFQGALGSKQAANYSIKALNEKLMDLGVPGIGTINKKDNEYVKELMDTHRPQGGYHYDPDKKNFGYQGMPGRYTYSEVFKTIIDTLAHDGVSTEIILPRAHRIFIKLLTSKKSSLQ